ncbi:MULTISPECIES: DUF6978 family protein [Lactiplantibacillus]|uniref:Uncharacterized protein n=3 Tax=Lactiplantibacillus pentosus TaxID=1589 RepID=A0A8B4YRS2_LACPE|nr:MULTISPECIES: hypothetical protein [Lactiplantibacillus]AYG36482.1 hypothetical protein CFK27_00275 [Lactiplantibacillus pentosus]AYG42110.1 hypothetical protein CFI14_13855 [Lactiplantibacillus pentosus]AYJ41014.1 hypothetical protein LP314_03415 [Lactiplantibacillus pentosus]KRK23926.1 hypothetical protein FD24_GL000598 [Lactiplantibacillus pentosus DSM 20314]MBO9166553.1 hypothetical protein [Lactiplantibacillus pentosus]
MEDTKYSTLHNYPKITNQNKLFCAVQGSQKVFNGHAVFNSNEQFKVIQVRKGHIRKKDLTYVLMYRHKEIMLRVDLIGATHQGTPTPHVHIFDESHDNGLTVIPLNQIPEYNTTDNVIESLGEFLKYNNFQVELLEISEPTV